MAPLAVLPPTPTEQASPADAPPADQRNLDWLRRSMASRTETQVAHEVMKLTTGVRLFENYLTTQDEIPILDRSEVQTSSVLVGQGAFSEVYSVQGFTYKTENESSQDPFQEQARSQLLEKHHQQTKHNKKNCPYVMKHLRRGLLTNRKQFCHAAADLVLEAKFLSRFQHPHILKLRGVASGPGAYGSPSLHDGFFLILDRLDETLSQRIQRWREQAASSSSSLKSSPSSSLSVYREKLEYARQIASALDYLHDRQIIYRDLKPDNCGFNTDGDIQIFDFGLCREIEVEHPTEDQVFHMSGVGTRRYMAPEVFLGHHYNCKADIYSWSIVLYSMISLQKPFEQLTADLHRLLVCQEGLRPSLLAEWPQEIRSLLQDGWATKPADRPTAKALVQRLESTLELNDENVSPSSQQRQTKAPRAPTNTSSSLMETSISNLMDSILPQCTSGNSSFSAGRILRLLETQIVAGGGTPPIIRREHQTSYPHLQHLRSAYL